MTLKKSFWGSLFENLKRRKAGLVTAFLVLFFAGPVVLLLSLSNNYEVWRYDEMISDAQKLEYLMETALEIIECSYADIFVFGILGLIMAYQGFGWLHKKNKVDLYNSVPVSYNKRFAIICLNSLFMVLAPMLVCFLISLLVLGAYNILDFNMAMILLLSMLLGLAFFAGAFSITALAVCLTGNRITALLGTAVLAFYEIVVVFLINYYMDSFFGTYVGQLDYAAGNSGVWPHFSIAYYMLMITKAAGVSLRGFFYEGYYSEIRADGMLISSSDGGRSGVFYLIIMLLLTMLTLALAWFCFKKRPAESAGRSMAFTKTKKIIKFFIMVPASLIGAEFFMKLGGEDAFSFIIGFVVTAVLGSMLIEIIYEEDIKCFSKHIVDIFTICIMAVVFFGAFYFDIFGYDAYMPGRESIEGISVTEGDGEVYSYLEKIELPQSEEYKARPFVYRYISEYEYWNQHPFTEDESIDAVIDMVKNSREFSGDRDNGDGNNGEAYESIYVTYHLKNGKEKLRKYTVSTEILKKDMDIIRGTEVYKKSSMQGIYELGDAAGYISFQDADGNTEKIADAYTEELLECYRKDMEGHTMADLEGRTPIGAILLGIDVELLEGERLATYQYADEGNHSYIYVFGYPIYDDFTNTISCIEK